MLRLLGNARTGAAESFAIHAGLNKAANESATCKRPPGQDFRRRNTGRAKTSRLPRSVFPRGLIDDPLDGPFVEPSRESMRREVFVCSSASDSRCNASSAKNPASSVGWSLFGLGLAEQSRCTGLAVRIVVPRTNDPGLLGRGAKRVEPLALCRPIADEAGCRLGPAVRGAGSAPRGPTVGKRSGLGQPDVQTPKAVRRERRAEDAAASSSSLRARQARLMEAPRTEAPAPIRTPSGTDDRQPSEKPARTYSKRGACCPCWLPTQETEVGALSPMERPSSKLFELVTLAGGAPKPGRATSHIGTPGPGFLVSLPLPPDAPSSCASCLPCACRLAVVGSPLRICYRC